MTFARFSEIWDEHYHPPVLTGPDVLVMEGSSQRTIDALIAYGQGDTSHFDRAREVLRERFPNRYPKLPPYEGELKVLKMVDKDGNSVIRVSTKPMQDDDMTELAEHSAQAFLGAFENEK